MPIQYPYKRITASGTYRINPHFQYVEVSLNEPTQAIVNLFLDKPIIGSKMLIRYTGNASDSGNGAQDGVVIKQDGNDVFAGAMVISALGNTQPQLTLGKDCFVELIGSTENKWELINTNSDLGAILGLRSFTSRFDSGTTQAIANETRTFVDFDLHYHDYWDSTQKIIRPYGSSTTHAAYRLVRVEAAVVFEQTGDQDDTFHAAVATPVAFGDPQPLIAGHAHGRQAGASGGQPCVRLQGLVPLVGLYGGLGVIVWHDQGGSVDIVRSCDEDSDGVFTDRTELKLTPLF